MKGRVLARRKDGVELLPRRDAGEHGDSQVGGRHELCLDPKLGEGVADAARLTVAAGLGIGERR